MIERSRRHALVALLVGAVVALGGCSDDPAEPKPLPSSSSSKAASPSPSAPTLPPEAQGTSAGAAEAFARHYVDLINYAMVSGDTSEMQQLAQQRCSTCFEISSDIKGLYSKKGRAEGGGWRVLTKSKQVSRGAGQVVFLQFRIRIRPQTIYASPGATASNSKAGSGRLEFELTRSGGDWKVVRLGAFN